MKNSSGRCGFLCKYCLLLIKLIFVNKVISSPFSNSKMPNKGYEKITNDEDDATDSCHPSMSANVLSLLSFWWKQRV